jgi:hypothetical protein
VGLIPLYVTSRATTGEFARVRPIPRCSLATGIGRVGDGELDPGAIVVLENPGRPMPIGMALAVGWTEGRLAVWRLTVKGAEIPGQWVIVDREFRLAPT